MNCAKMAESIMYRFGRQTRMGSRKPALDRSPDAPQEGTLLRGNVLKFSCVMDSSSLGAHCRLQQERHCVAAIRSGAKLLWTLVEDI